MKDKHLRGGIPWFYGKKVKSMPTGRKCKYRGCKTILSIYNYAPYCSVHLRKVLDEKAERMEKWTKKK